MLQGVAALKLKGNLYFLSSLHTQSNKQLFWLLTQSVPQIVLYDNYTFLITRSI